MSSQPNLSSSGSASSLLLNSANLAWTPPGGILVQPQPPVEALRSSRSTPTRQVDSANSNRSTPAISDNFQTVNLNSDSKDISDISLSLEQTKISTDSNQPTGYLDVSSNKAEPSEQEVTSSQVYPYPTQQELYFQPNQSPDTVISSYQKSEECGERQTLQGPKEPPKGSLFSLDFKRRGPLRLYDPNHGLDNSTPAISQPSSDYSQEIASSFGSTDQHLDPVPGSSAQQFYSQIESVSNETSFVSTEQDVNQTETGAVNYCQSENQWNQQQQYYSQPTEYTANYASYYVPVQPHWFYMKYIEGREVWMPFSMLDSVNLEDAWRSHYGQSGFVISTDGGRYDVFVNERVRRAVYWSEHDSIVRRCTWFYKKDGHLRPFPYAEDFAAQLEEYFREAFSFKKWGQPIVLAGQESIVMYNENSIYHYQPENNSSDEWGSMVENPVRPLTVLRGSHEFEIFPGEPTQVDHLVFLVHGIGEICDFRFRSIVEVVDDFRNIHLSMMQTHFKQHLESGTVGRIELLPVSWHAALHGDETGIDSRLKLITLNSIPKLRHFSNDTILDALFYTSPLYCQTIVDTVGYEMNRLYELFKFRNPNFNGSVAIGGHSLGSLIVFDILAHQNFDKNNPSMPTHFYKSHLDNDFTVDINTIELVCQKTGLTEYLSTFYNEKIDFQVFLMLTEEQLHSLGLPLGARKKLVNIQQQILYQKNNSPPMQTPQSPSSPGDRKESVTSISYTIGHNGTGYPTINYPKLDFMPSVFFAMGSPIAMFLTVRGIETLSLDYRLPSCSRVFNIFHPFDPIAYRIEPLIDPSFKDIPPILIPHHKGRKRMHLELKESLTKITDLKQKIMDSLKSTWNSIHDFAIAHRVSNDSSKEVEDEVDKVVEELQRENQEADQEFNLNKSIGQLNSGRRIDHVLQEKPFEIFNEYLFAMISHACYWESEDTALMMLKELYSPFGIHPLTQKELQTSSREDALKLYNPALRHSNSNQT